MIRATCEVKVKDRIKTNEIMQMFGGALLNERMVRATAMRWYGHVSRRKEESILKEVLNFKVIGRRKTKDYWEKTG